MKTIFQFAVIVILIASYGFLMSHLGKEQGYKEGYAQGFNKAHKILRPMKFDIEAESVQTLEDKDTGCIYAIIDKQAVTPVYKSDGKVAGCGQIHE